MRFKTKQDFQQLVAGTHEAQQNPVRIGYREVIENKGDGHNEGDTWTDADGALWEKKNGYVVRHGKKELSELRDELRKFKNCPKDECTCYVPKRLDEKMRLIHGKCFQCVIEYEQKLIIEGKFEEYEKSKISDNIKGWIQDADKEVEVFADALEKVEYVNEFGDVERWQNVKNIPIDVRQKWDTMKSQLTNFAEHGDFEGKDLDGKEEETSVKG